MYIKRNRLLSPSWITVSDRKERVRAWYAFHVSRLARAADIDGLKIDVDRFTEWVLDPGNVATRPRSPDRHQKLPMRGRHVSRGAHKTLRASDLSERVYVCVRLLELKGFTNKLACLEVARVLDWKWKLQKTKRGRPRLQKTAPDFWNKSQIVRSLANKYRRRYKGMKPDSVVFDYVAAFLHFQDWIETARVLLETPEGKAAYEKRLGADYIKKFISPGALEVGAALIEECHWVAANRFEREKIKGGRPFYAVINWACHSQETREFQTFPPRYFVAAEIRGASFQPEGVTVETATKTGNVREAVRNCHEVIVAGALVRSPRPRPE